MKVNLLCLVAMTLFFSCNGQENLQNQSSEKSTPETVGNAALLKKQKACEALSLTTIARLMDVDESAMKQEDMSFGKRSICFYYTKEGNRKFFIRMTWESEKNAENKALQKRYTKYLSEGENGIKEYTEVQNNEQGQILFGIGQDREGKYIHILRKRYGNNAEVQLELTKENKDDMAQKSLMKAINEIE